MSFVLEALRKQEAARDPEAAVSLARQQSDRRRHRLWAGLFALAMAVNVVVLAWMFRPWASAPTTGTEPRPLTGTPAETAMMPAPGPGDTTGDAVDATRAEPPAATATAAPAGLDNDPVQAPAAPAPVTVALQDLPADARTRFPGIAFSTHIYSDDASLRAIVANGQRLGEGDRIRGLEILAITETGVTLAFENYRVNVPIVTDW